MLRSAFSIFASRGYLSGLMSKNTAIHVILVPGADDLPFSEDLDAAERCGASVHPLQLPALTGHPIDSRPPFFNAIADKIALEIADIRSKTLGARVFGIGRNHGGSLLAYAAARDGGFDGLVFPGVIPALSAYRVHSELASARQFRAKFDNPEELARIPELRPFDMASCLEKIDASRCLIQVGHADDWMDAASHACFKALKANYTVQWLDDDHAMAAAETVAARWSFIQARAAA